MSDTTHRRPTPDASTDRSAATSPDASGRPGDTSPDVSRLTIAEAARRLDTTETAVRMRIRRGTLPSEKDTTGRLWVLLADTSTDASGDTSTDTSPTRQATRRDTSTDASADTSASFGADEPIDVAYRVNGEAGEAPTALVPLATMLIELGHFADRIERLAREASEERQRRIQAESERDALQTRLTSALGLVEAAEATVRARLDVIDEMQEAAAERDTLRARLDELEAERAAAPPEPAAVAAEPEPSVPAEGPAGAAAGRPGVIRRWWTWLVGESA